MRTFFTPITDLDFENLEFSLPSDPYNVENANLSKSERFVYNFIKKEVNTSAKPQSLTTIKAFYQREYDGISDIMHFAEFDGYVERMMNSAVPDPEEALKNIREILQTLPSILKNLIKAGLLNASLQRPDNNTAIQNKKFDFNG